MQPCFPNVAINSHEENRERWGVFGFGRQRKKKSREGKVCFSFKWGCQNFERGELFFFGVTVSLKKGRRKRFVGGLFVSLG